MLGRLENRPGPLLAFVEQKAPFPKSSLQREERLEGESRVDSDLEELTRCYSSEIRASSGCLDVEIEQKAFSGVGLQFQNAPKGASVLPASIPKFRAAVIADRW